MSTNLLYVIDADAPLTIRSTVGDWTHTCDTEEQAREIVAILNRHIDANGAYKS